MDQLYRIVSVLGSSELLRYIRKYEVELPREILEGLPENKRTNFGDFFEDASPSPLHLKAADLLEKVLVYDHQRRLTARECIEHPFLC